MRGWIYGFFMTWGMFLSIPCPVRIWDEKARGKMMAVSYTHLTLPTILLV